MKNSSLSPLLSYRTNARTTSFNFTEEDISLTIKNFEKAKMHACKNMSIVVSH